MKTQLFLIHLKPLQKQPERRKLLRFVWLLLEKTQSEEGRGQGMGRRGWKQAVRSLGRGWKQEVGQQGVLQVSKEVCSDVLQLSTAAALLGAGTHGEVFREPRRSQEGCTVPGGAGRERCRAQHRGSCCVTLLLWCSGSNRVGFFACLRIAMCMQMWLHFLDA